MSQERGRLPGSLLRWAAEAVLSQRVLESVVLPVLADLQHENESARNARPLRRLFVVARGYFAFWAALALCLGTWPARSLREDWLATDAPGPRVLRAFLPRAGVLGVVVTAMMILDVRGRSPRLGGDPLLVLAHLPALIVYPALPLAFLLGLVLAMRRIDAENRRLPLRDYLGSIVGLSAAAAIFSFILVGWITPEANQYFRERFYGRASTEQQRAASDEGTRVDADRRAIPRGSRELTLGELRTAMLEARARGVRSGELEAEWQKKWSIPAMSLVFGPLAVGLTGALRRRSVALPIAYPFAALFTWSMLLRLGEQAARAGRLEPLVAMWLGNVLFGLVALSLLTRSGRPAEGRPQPVS